MTRRALILAGGGLKVAFQAGVLQVLLDEAHVEFERADGASGGLLNLVQWCEGRTGTDIADGWRAMRPVRNVDPNWPELWRGPYADSLFRLDRFRAQIRTLWKLDWERIRTQTARPATCNVFNFTRQELRVVPQSQMTEDLLVAGISLPGWFPPVVVDGDRYIDAVYATDANLEAAIAKGADELWIVWTVSRRGTWRRGTVAQYFQTIEAAANSRMQDVRDRIDRSNDAIARGECGEFDHHVECRILEHDVPLHYLFAFGADRMAEVVDLGVAGARRWCDHEEIARDAPTSSRRPRARPPVRMHFRERAAGWFAFDAASAATGRDVGSKRGDTLRMRLTVTVDDVERFVRDPDHLGHCKGWVSADALAGHGRWVVTDDSTFRLMVPDPDEPYRPDRQVMLYHLYLRNGSEERTLVARKTCDARGRTGIASVRKMWTDTTTFDVELFATRVSPEDVTASTPSARGQMTLTLLDFAGQLATYRTDAHNVTTGLAAITRFDRMFLGHLWDIYATNVLSSSPF